MRSAATYSTSGADNFDNNWAVKSHHAHVNPVAPVGSLADMPSTLATTIFSSADSGGSSILSFLFLPLILVAMYFLMIRPQRKRMRDQQDLQKSVEVGQDVVTTSGVFGTITGEDGPNRFWLEIDDDVQIRIARAAIQNVVDLEDDDAVADKAIATEEAVEADGVVDNGPADAPASTED
ncbi:MAG: preprotein translocase subunit YajC [Candidatus Azotimanducaceae bacterium]|jgi:preprotein translocase subunit YajC